MDRISAGFTRPIASAVAAEVMRLDPFFDTPLNHHREYRRLQAALNDRPLDNSGEGAAYKAAWDRAGSGWLHHVRASSRDCIITEWWVTHPENARALLDQLTRARMVRDLAVT